MSATGPVDTPPDGHGTPDPLAVSCDDPPTCRPALPRIKSCLKISPSHSGTSTPLNDDDASPPPIKKHVAFCEEGTEEVHEADEWDRTPAEIQRLTYGDILKLKMLLRELPRAEQPADALSSKPFANVFLTKVPIPLLPLNPTTISSNGHIPSPSCTSPNAISPPTTPRLARDVNVPPPTTVLTPHNIPVPPPPVSTQSTYTSAPSSFLKSNLPPRKRTFSFVPLLDDSSHGLSISSTPTPTATPFTMSPISSAEELPPLPSSDSDGTIVDTGDVSDCSVTEVSTPSLTTASLASSSPPESPSTDCPDHFSGNMDTGCAGRKNGDLSCRPEENNDDDDDEAFLLNLDVDTDVDLTGSYFPSLPPLHSTPSVSRVPVSSFHARHPHLTASNRINAGTSEGTRNRKTGGTGNANANADDNSDGNGCAMSMSSLGSDCLDSLTQLRLRAIPSPELDVPSPLQLPSSPSDSRAQPLYGKVLRSRCAETAEGSQGKKLPPRLVPGPVVEPAAVHEEKQGVLVFAGADERIGTSPSLPRA
ncbi:hypothetical protein EDD16DRAFT_60829 [Pisolithus croceorrhizus]|nr:hypothetical protein EDD16DRAFT_60829 [Pisolithus croceorrhizus]KAI6124933.1 hypothetical protein EV401DRAFT_1153629 [Pisolithus croceorrhizus]